MNVVNSEAESCVVVYLPNPEEEIAKLEENIEAIRSILGPKLKFEVGFNVMPNSCTPRTLKKLAEEKMNADGDADDTDKFVNFLEKRKAVCSSFSSNLIDGHDVYSLQMHDDPFHKAPDSRMETFFSLLVKKMGHVMKPYGSLAKKDPVVEEKSTEDDAFDIGLRPSKKFREMEEARLQEQKDADGQKVTRERSDAIVGDFNKYLADNATATEAMVKAAEKMAQSGSFMAEAATHLPKEFYHVQTDSVQMIDKNVNHTDNSKHQHAHLHAQPPAHGHQPDGGLVSRPTTSSNMHSTTYNREVERLRQANGLGGKLYEESSREERKRLEQERKRLALLNK